MNNNKDCRVWQLTNDDDDLVYQDDLGEAEVVAGVSQCEQSEKKESL